MTTLETWKEVQTEQCLAEYSAQLMVEPTACPSTQLMVQTTVSHLEQQRAIGMALWKELCWGTRSVIATAGL